MFLIQLIIYLHKEFIRSLHLMALSITPINIDKNEVTVARNQKHSLNLMHLTFRPSHTNFSDAILYDILIVLPHIS